MTNIPRKREAHDNKVTEAEKELEGLREEENELNRGKPGKGESHRNLGGEVKKRNLRKRERALMLM